MPDDRRLDASPEHGASLLLMPAALLVFIVLGVLAVDVGAIHLAQRELITATQAAANDAAVAGFDVAAYYDDGTVRLDPAAARTAAMRALAAHDPSLRLVDLQVTGVEVEVEVEGVAMPIFGRAVPGQGARATTLHGRARAELRP